MSTICGGNLVKMAMANWRLNNENIITMCIDGKEITDTIANLYNYPLDKVGNPYCSLNTDCQTDIQYKYIYYWYSNSDLYVMVFADISISFIISWDDDDDTISIHNEGYKPIDSLAKELNKHLDKYSNCDEGLSTIICRSIYETYDNIDNQCTKIFMAKAMPNVKRCVK